MNMLQAKTSIDWLDRPIWWALRSRQSTLAEGQANAVYFQPDFAPFASTADDSLSSLRDLAELIRRNGPLVLLQRDRICKPEGCAFLAEPTPGVQMILGADAEEVNDGGDHSGRTLLISRGVGAGQ